MDRLDSMRVFLRVAETGSFTKAADLLDMPRATVSAAVQQLEAQLGSRLLHRTTRQVQLTHDGSVVLERCRHLLEDMEELESLFRDGSRASGRLKVDVPSRVARLLIAPALPEFFRQHPDIELELGSSDRSVDLVQEGVDCVLRVGQLGNSSLVARRLGEMQLINCASPAYLEEHGEPRTPADLDRHWAVNYASPSSGRVLPWEYREDGRTLTRALRSRVTVNNAESYIACCLSGLGLIQILPTTCASTSNAASCARCCRSGGPKRCRRTPCIRTGGICRGGSGHSSTGWSSCSAPASSPRRSSPQRVPGYGKRPDSATMRAVFDSPRESPCPPASPPSSSPWISPPVRPPWRWPISWTRNCAG